MNQKELTKTFVMISNEKTPFVGDIFLINSARKGKRVKNDNSRPQQDKGWYNMLSPTRTPVPPPSPSDGCLSSTDYNSQDLAERRAVSVG